MSAAPFPQFASPLRSGFVASPLKCSRQSIVAPDGYEIWRLINADSIPSDAGAYNPSTIPATNFFNRNPEYLVSTCASRVWATEISGYPPTYGFPTWLYAANETPASYSFPYAACSPVLNAGDGYNYPDSGAWANALYLAIWGGQLGAANVSTWGPGVPAAYWFYWPDWHQGTAGYHNCWQNPLVANRSRYRVSRPCNGFEASCELWVQYLDTGTGVWNWGWETYVGPAGTLPGSTTTRIWARTFALRNRFAANVFYGGTGSTDVTSAWNEVLFPPTGVSDPFYSLTDTAMNGFLGKMIFHVIGEDPIAWQTRTGFSF